MAKFNTGQSFTDGDTVTGAKLNNITSLLDIYSGVIADQTAIAATVSTADLLLLADTDAGSSGAVNKVTVQKLLDDTLTAGTFTNANLAAFLTYGTATGNRTISTSATITNGTITTGLIPTLTAGTTTGTAGIFTSGTIATLNSTTGTIATLVATSNSTLQGLNIGRGGGNIASNTSLGSSALASNTTGINNTASGVSALFLNTTGSNNTASGLNALSSNTTGINNTASGLNALLLNTTAANNTACGNSALFSNTTGSNNTASGFQALSLNTTGSYNTASGVSALFSNTTGANNTASGIQAGYGVGTNSNTTGDNNTFIGSLSVGASATASNVVTLGNGSIATLRCQVTSITALSDKRDKKDIANLSVGLDFIGKLRPVSFNWDTRDKAKVDIPDAGFIAQELLVAQEEAGVTIPNLVSQENPEKLEAAYGTLIPVLVQAIKELKAKVELLEEKNK